VSTHRSRYFNDAQPPGADRSRVAWSGFSRGAHPHDPHAQALAYGFDRSAVKRVLFSNLLAVELSTFSRAAYRQRCCRCQSHQR